MMNPSKHQIVLLFSRVYYYCRDNPTSFRTTSLFSLIKKSHIFTLQDLELFKVRVVVGNFWLKMFTVFPSNPKHEIAVSVGLNPVNQ